MDLSYVLTEILSIQVVRGEATTVPFEPTKGKPIYCRTCFSKRRTKRRETSTGPITFDMKNAWASRGVTRHEKKPEKSIFTRT